MEQRAHIAGYEVMQNKKLIEQNTDRGVAEIK